MAHDTSALDCWPGAARWPGRRPQGAVAACKLSRAKHVAGRPRRAWRKRDRGPDAVLRVSTERRFFRADDAPDERGRAAREAASRGSPRFYRRALRRRSRPRPPRCASWISDLAVHRRLPRAVPVQPRGAREPASRAASASRPRASLVTDLDGNAFYDLTGSYGVNLFGYDFYKETASREGAATRRRARPGARRLPPGRGRQRRAAAGDLRPRRGVVPHVGHRGGDAGGAAGALSHRPHAPGALLRRLSRLVGRRAAGRRQSGRRPTHLHARRHERATLRGAAHAHATSPACWSIRCRRCTPTRGAPGDSTLVDSSRTRAVSTARPTRAWLQRLRRDVLQRAGIVLIFDEVFIGFRLAPGGAQEYFGIAARHGHLRQDAGRRAAGRRAVRPRRR